MVNCTKNFCLLLHFGSWKLWFTNIGSSSQQLTADDVNVGRFNFWAHFGI